MCCGSETTSPRTPHAPLLSRAVPRVGRKTEIMVGGFEALKRETAKPEEPERGPVKFLVWQD